MKLFSSAKDIVFCSVIFVLVAALVFSGVVIKQKSDAAKAVKEIISQNEEKIEAADEKISQLEEELKQKEAQTEEAQTKLAEIEAQKQQLEAEKRKLEQANRDLKNQIALLKAQKEQQVYAPAGTVQASAPEARRVCYLTFDDGPSSNTLRILLILEQYGVKATFFVMSTSKIEYVKQVKERGHTIGLHTSSHDYATVYSSVSAYFADLQQISDTVEALTGVQSKIIRFPGGSSNTKSQNYCKGIMTALSSEVTARGYSYFDWNVSSGDASSARPSAAYIKNCVLNGARNKNSICVLMHDSAGKTTTVDALPGIILGLFEMGYTFAPLQQTTYGYHQPIAN